MSDDRTSSCGHPNPREYRTTVLAGSQLEVSRFFQWCPECGALRLFQIDDRDQQAEALRPFLNLWNLPKRRFDG